MKIIIEKDKNKAKSLVSMAKTTLERLNSTNKNKYPSNTLVDYYEIIKKILEALCVLNGIKFKGDASHFETINYVCNNYELGESKKVFLQQIRDYRNKISYEGFNVKEDYIKINTEKFDKLINQLLEKVDEKLLPKHGKM